MTHIGFPKAVSAGCLFNCLLAGILLASTASAGGLYVSEFATPDMITASAGQTARVGDASTAGLNPAGMTNLDDHELMGGVAPGYGFVKFDPASDTPVDGSSGGNQGGLVPLVSGSYVHHLSDRVRLGLAAFSIAGASLDPRDSWVGRNQIQKIDLLTFSALPSVAVRVTDRLSVGGGPLLTYATLDWQVEGPLTGGKVKLKNFDDFEPAAFVGLLFRVTDDVRVGLVYQSKIDLRLKGSVQNPLSEPINSKLGLPLAELVHGDVWWDVTPKLSLTVGGGWENWSDADQVPLSTGAGGTEVKLGMSDTWKVRGGMHYRWNDTWTLGAGISYDSSPLHTRDRIAALPLDEQWRLGVGAIHELSGERQLSFGLEWLYLGNADLNNNQVKGNYDTNSVLFFMVNMDWKKLPWSSRGEM